MTTGHVFIATSLDGFIARDDGDLSWLMQRDDPSEDHGYTAFLQEIDVIVMGSASFDVIRHFTPWPYDLPVIVLSARPAPSDIDPTLRTKLRFSAATPRQVMEDLNAQGFRRAYLDGGRVIQSFLREGLITDMVISTVPVLLGQGRRLFGPLPADIALQHQRTTAFPSGLVQSHYRLIPPPGANP